MHRLKKLAVSAFIAAAAAVISPAPAGRAYADEMTPIMGEAVLTESQMLRYLDSVYPDAPDVVKTLPAIYLEEGELEGVRGTPHSPRPVWRQATSSFHPARQSGWNSGTSRALASRRTA